MSEKIKNYIILHAIIFVWGFTGILGKIIDLDSTVIVWYRMFIAFASLFIFLKIKKKTIEFNDNKEFFKIAGVGVIVALHWILFYKSIQLSTASLGILCLSTTTLHVSWLEPIVMKRKFSIMEFLLGLLVIIGIIIVSDEFTINEFIALGYGLTAALMAAMFSVFNAKLNQKTSSANITLIEMLIGFLFITLILFLNDKINVENLSMTISDFSWLLFLGIVCTSLAFMTMIDIVKKLGAFTVSLSINFEPIYTIILAALLLAEYKLLSWKFYLGAIIIIFVVLLNAIIKTKNNSKL